MSDAPASLSSKALTVSMRSGRARPRAGENGSMTVPPATVRCMTSSEQFNHVFFRQATWSTYTSDDIPEEDQETAHHLAFLTDPYEPHMFWFEVFECARKILLIGLPVVFSPGSSGQLIIGLLICFLSYGMYGVFAPYTDPSE